MGIETNEGVDGGDDDDDGEGVEDGGEDDEEDLEGDANKFFEIGDRNCDGEDGAAVEGEEHVLMQEGVLESKFIENSLDSIATMIRMDNSTLSTITYCQ